MKRIIAFLPYIIFFFATLYTPKDIDLGWHLKYGEHLVKTGTLLTTNILSTTLPNYTWVSSSWLLDPVIYLIYNHIGFIGLSVFGALITTLILFVISKGLRATFAQIIWLMLFLFFYLDPVISASIRGQVISLLFLAYLCSLLQNIHTNIRGITIQIVVLFLIWVNIHTQYSLGLGVLGVWTSMYALSLLLRRKKVPWVSLAMLVGGSILVTFINPRGFHILDEIAKHVNDPSQKAIIEWIPFSPRTDLWFQFLVLIVSLQLISIEALWQKKILRILPLTIIVSILAVLTWLMRRYAWSLVIVAPFFVWPSISNFHFWKDQLFQKFSVFVLVIFCAWQVLVRLPGEKVTTNDWDRYCTDSAECSFESAQYIHDHNLAENLWTYYGYGGWLIWNFPDIKPSMDGRMPSWRDEAGYSPFLTYYDQEQNITSIDDSEYDTVYTIINKPIYNQLLRLEEEKKWKTVYEDNVAAIFVRIKPAK